MYIIDIYVEVCLDFSVEQCSCSIRRSRARLILRIFIRINIYTRFQKRCNLKIYIKYIYTFSFLIKKWWLLSSENLATRFLQCRLSPFPQRHAFDTRPPSSHGVLAQWLRCDRVQAWLPILQCRLSTPMNETSFFQPAIPAFKRKLSPQVFATPPKPAALDCQPPSKCRIM